MERSENSDSRTQGTLQIINNPVQRANLEAPQELVIRVKTTAAGQFCRRLFSILFYIHLGLIFVLVVFLTVDGVISASKHHHFSPKKWYPPLLTSTAIAGILAFSWQSFTACNPHKAIRAAFWLGPLSAGASGVIFIIVGDGGSLAIGILFLVSSLILGLYACWVRPRLCFATKILSISTEFPPHYTTTLSLRSIITGVLDASLIACGVGGALAGRFAGFEALFIAILLLSLVWTMQVIKNVMFVTISRVRYLNFASGANMDTRAAFRDTLKYLIGSISIGSIIVPFLTVVRGSARAINLVAGESDEFLFSCADCYSKVASTLIARGNRWGYVHVGVYKKGFVQASVDAWEMFKRNGLEELIDSDLTGAFCFLCGVAGGGVCCVASGAWALAVHRSYAAQLAIYAFLIGYFMCRVGMSWPQGCVAAYYVAYAENPQSPRFDSTIPDRVRDMHRRRAA